MSDLFKPSVCIDAVFGGMPPEQAISVVAESGIRAFEFWGWWDKDLAAVESAKERHELDVSACCTKFISLVDPANRDEYLGGLTDSIAAAQSLGCRTLISQVGDFREGVDRREQYRSLVDGLKAAAKILSGSGVTLVIEPLNELVDHAGYYLVRSEEAFRIIDEVDCPQVKVVFDIYHQQISEGNLISNIVRNIHRIGHFHAAGNPGRHELNVGEIYYPAIFDAIRGTNYQGYVGLEYWPIHDPGDGLREVGNWF